MNTKLKSKLIATVLREHLSEDNNEDDFKEKKRELLVEKNMLLFFYDEINKKFE